MSSTLKDIVAKIEQGSSWISFNKVSGRGSSFVEVSVPSGWKGRLPRETFCPVKKKRTTKLIKIVQKGLEMVTLDSSALSFDMDGGTAIINVRLNSESVKASILPLGGEAMSNSYIKTMTINGLSLNVPDEDGRNIVYSDPDDPGATDLYDVSFLIIMPRNPSNKELSEVFFINGKTVNIYQRANNIPFIEIERDFDNVTSDDGSVSLRIISNTDYDIELVCCSCGNEPDPKIITISPSVIPVRADGYSDGTSVITDDDVSWTVNSI